eukprot:1070443-Rhodomonas_salina.1
MGAVRRDLGPLPRVLWAPGHVPYQPTRFLRVSGTDRQCAATGLLACYAMSGTDRPHAGTGLRACYEVSGTALDRAYDAIRCANWLAVWCYADHSTDRLHHTTQTMSYALDLVCEATTDVLAGGGGEGGGGGGGEGGKEAEERVQRCAGAQELK